MSQDQKSYEDNKYPIQGNCINCFEGKQCHSHSSFNNVKLESTDLDEEFSQTSNIDESEKGIAADISKLNVENVSHKEDLHPTKSSSSKDISEVSPFKQAVKGFVLKKLNSKKVSSSPILSGITGKIVKKLEDGKENPTALPHAKSEQIISFDNKDQLQTCELKSVVANDLVDGVEEASECFEEKEKNTSNKSFQDDSQLSMSLPTSPAHKMGKKSRSCSFEDLQKDRFDIPLFSISKDNMQNSSHDIELQDFTETSNELIDPIYSKHFESNHYPSNIYLGKEEETISLKETVWKYLDMLCSLRHILSLPVPHLFLVLSIAVHNSQFLSEYLGLVFDSIVVGYIIYSYVCISLQLSFEKTVATSTSSSSPASYSENAATIIKTKKDGDTTLKGRVKVLKGDFDPDMVKRPQTDTVEISIENCCLKLSYQKKNMDEPQFCFVYDISDAKISIVPKTLKKKKIWKKKYPICILLSPVAKSYEDINDSEELRATDYLSLVTYEDALVETTKQRALYIFALTDREKQSLFWALYHNLKACDLSSVAHSACETYQKTSLTNQSYISLVENIDEKSVSFTEDSPEEEQKDSTPEHPLSFFNYMEVLFENCRKKSKLIRSRSAEDILISKEDFTKASETTLPKEFMYCDYYPVDWLNIVLGRLFYDFLTKKHWSDEVKAKIQRKLDKIEMPNFIESLRINEVILGDCLPVVHSVTQPIEDSYGVWLNFDFEYSGTFQMTIETKLKITSNYVATTEQFESPNGRQSLSLSDSSDEDGNEKGQGSPRKSRILNKIEKWISHRHFATVAQSKLVKRYVGDLTNMPLTLTVEISSLNGILTVNLPPEPSDRIWYGFQKDPDLSLNVFPKVGKLEINLSAVVLTIQKKLIQEFKKALVMPNMDDLIIPIMYAPTLVQ